MASRQTPNGPNPQQNQDTQMKSSSGMDYSAASNSTTSSQSTNQHSNYNMNPQFEPSANGRSTESNGTSNQESNTEASRQQQNVNKNNGNSKEDYIPSRRSAIILENTQNVSQDQCLRAVADIIGGLNIHYCSRLSGGRICIYLTNESHVDKMCQERGVIINSEFIPCRRYVSEAKKFVISNCPPELSDDGLSELMKPYGRIVSTPTRLRVTTTHQDLRHVKTWRRTIFMMIPSDAPEVPPRILITSADGLKQTLYIEKDDLFCTHCKAPGHSIEKCKPYLNKEFPEFQPPASHRLHVRHQRTNTTSNNTVNLMPTFNNQSEAVRENRSEQPNRTGEEQDGEKKNSNQDPVLGDLINMEDNQLQLTKTSTKQQQQPQFQDLFPGEPNFSVNKIIEKNLTILDQELSGGEDIDTSLASGSLTSNQLYEKITKKSKRRGKRLLSPEITEKPTVFKVLKTALGPPPEDSSPMDTSDGDSSSYSVESNDSTSRVKKKNKKEKDEATLNQLIQKMTFDDSKLNSVTFLSFLQQARGKSNSKIVVERLSANTTELIKKLNEAHIKCTDDFNLQRKLKRASDALTPGIEYDNEN